MVNNYLTTFFDTHSRIPTTPNVSYFYFFTFIKLCRSVLMFVVQILGLTKWFGSAFVPFLYYINHNIAILSRGHCHSHGPMLLLGDKYRYPHLPPLLAVIEI